MAAPEVQGIDLFKIAGRSISGWIPSLKTGTVIRQPFCSQLEERLLLWLEYHPLVVNYARGDIDPEFATKYRLPIPQHAPFAIGYTFESKPHHYLPDVVGILANGKPFIAEAGMEDDKRGDRNLAKAEAARRLVRLQQGTFWIGTERRLSKRLHYNLVYLHARRKTFPAFGDIAAVLPEVWPWGEMAEVAEVATRLSHQFPVDLVEATIWKVVADAAAAGHLLIDLEQFTLSRTLPLALLSPDAPVLVPSPLPDTLLPEPDTSEVPSIRTPPTLIPGPTFDASTLSEPQREQFHRNLRAVEQVLAGATQSSVAEKEGIPRSTLGRLVRRTRQLGQIACVPHGSYRGVTQLHPAFAECIRRLFLLPTRLSMTAIREHTEMQQVAARLSKETGTAVKLPSYKQVRTAVQHLKMDPSLLAMREGAKSVPRERESAESFVLSIPAPALLTQVDEHTMDLYVVTPDGTTVASRVHAAVLICVKTAAILGAVLALGPLKEEDYMRLVKVSMERKDHLVGINGCEHSWPCFGKPAIIFHDRGKIFTSERARQVLVDRLGIITEQAPPYAPSAKGTVESLFRWMTERFEKRLPNSSYGVHNAETAAQAGGMTLEELERCFYQAIVDDYQRDFDTLRQQRRYVLWEQAVAASGVPQYLGSPDDLKLLLMKAVNRKTPHHGYRVQNSNRLSFQGRWYVCPGLLSRLRGREFDLYYDRRDVGVLYIFVEGEYVGEAYCPQLMGGRVSFWEARAMRKHDEEQARIACEQGLTVRVRIQDEARAARRRRSTEIRASEQARQWDRQRPDIHPALVSERLASVEAEITQVVTLADPRPDAEPDRPHDARGGTCMTHPLFRKEIFVETAFAKRFQQMLHDAWDNRSWHLIVADPGAGKTMSIRDLQKRAGGRSVLAVVAPKNNDDEQALGDQFLAALGLPIRGHWSTRKPKLMGHLHQYGTECLIVDDAHDLSLEHLMLLKEVTDQGRLQYDHPLGLCLVAAGRGDTIPLKETFDLPDPTWLQFRRRFDKLAPFCRIASHTSEEVRDILATLEQEYRPLLPQLNLRQWTSSIYAWLTHPVLDPTHSGRVTMDNLMKLVTTALEWSYLAGETDVVPSRLKSAAELLVLRHDTLKLIDGAGSDTLRTDQNKAEPTRVNGKEPERQTVPENAVPHTTKTAETVETAKEQTQTSKTAYCTFSGVVPIDLKRFTDSGISLVECPGCGRMRSLSPVKGILRFKSHTPRKQQTPLTAKRWSTTGKTDWEVVEGERK